MTPSIRFSLLLLVLALLGGCHTTTAVETTTLVATGPIAIDVTNFNGDVFIKGVEDLPYTTVTFERVGLHGSGREAEAEASLAEIKYSAELVPGEIGQVLQIRTRTSHAEPHFQRVHITIEAPLIDGVRVLTQRGKVYVQNVSGECDIETSFGNVRLMTTQAMTRGVSIVNRDGDIDYRTSGNSTGLIDAVADHGDVNAKVMLGQLSIRGATSHDTLAATLNDGENPIVLRTTNGDIRIAVIENPEAVGLKIFVP